MHDLIYEVIRKGGKLYASVSGGKDGQAMTRTLRKYGMPVEGMIHADLGRVEWPESLKMCERQSAELGIPLHIIKRADGLDLLGLWQRRMRQLEGTGKPFWSSSKNRYCTSDMKRDPINKFLRGTDHDLIVSCEGIRAEESSARSKKAPLTIREKVTSVYYKGMSVEEAIKNFRRGKRLALTWYPIFNFTFSDVLATYGLSINALNAARATYKHNGVVPEWWHFHPAYVYGNDRVSCVYCILGSNNDLHVGARHHPDLLDTMIDMQNTSGFTFKNNWSLENLKS